MSGLELTLVSSIDCDPANLNITEERRTKKKKLVRLLKKPSIMYCLSH